MTPAAFNRWLADMKLAGLARRQQGDTEMETAFDTYAIAAYEAGHRDLARRLHMERRMARAMVRACLDRGFMISVSDGQDWVVRKSRNYKQVMMALASTDEDVLVIRRADGSKAGWFQLVYGNDGYDVVADYSDNAECNSIWDEVISPLSDKLETGL